MDLTVKLLCFFLILLGKFTRNALREMFFILGLTLWLALEDVDEENGCIYYVPGSHKQGLLQHYKTDMIGFSQALVDYTSDMAFKEIPMCVKRGK